MRAGYKGISIICAIAFVGCVDTTGDRDVGSSAVREDPGSGPFDVNQDRGYTQDIIDDFELGAATGGWFANNDICEDCQKMAEEMRAADGGIGLDGGASTSLEECKATCYNSQSPTIFDKPLPADFIVGERRPSSQYALHLVTDKLTDWGANIGTALTPVKDATGWDGICFWARRAPYSRGTVRIEIGDNTTEPTQAELETLPDAVCDPTYNENALSKNDLLFKGCDRFGGHALVSTDWKFVAIPFDELRQAGWGKQEKGLNIEQLRSITFLFAAGTWDIWIDDVAFYKWADN